MIAPADQWGSFATGIEAAGQRTWLRSLRQTACLLGRVIA